MVTHIKEGLRYNGCCEPGVSSAQTKHIVDGKGILQRERVCRLRALLSACQADNPDAVYQNYLTRLGRTLEIEPPAVVSRHPPAHPDRHSLNCRWLLQP